MEMEGERNEINILRPESMLAALEMPPDTHLNYLLRLCKHLFANLSDAHVQTRYLMLMNAAVKRDVMNSRRLNGPEINAYTMDKNGLFKGLLDHLIATEFMKTSVVNGFRDVVGELMESSISFSDATAVEHILNPPNNEAACRIWKI